MPFYADLTFWMYVVAGAPYAAFVGFYAVRTPSWRRTPVGRALMSQAVSLTAVFAYICLLLAVPVPEEVKDLLRALLIGGVTIAGALMFKNLLVEQARRDRAGSP
ncbi:putative phage holin [Blastococcus sp. SYSU D00813]